MRLNVGRSVQGGVGVFAALRSAFAPLQIRDLRIYLSGQVVSLVGTWMQMTAQSWVVWELSHSAAALGITGMLSFLPILLLGPLAGVIADRLDRRRILVASQATAMLLAFTLALLVQTGIIRVWHVYILAAILGVVAAVDAPAQMAFIGDLSGVARVRQAVVLNSMIFQVSRMIGPVLAGLVVARLGTAMAFWLNGTSFLAAIASLLIVRAHQVRKASSGTAAGEFVEGIRFIRGQPRIQDLLAVTVLVTFFGISAMTVMPAVAAVALRGGADVLGLLMGASGAGALVGAVLLVPLAQRIPRVGLVVGGAALWTGLWFMLFSFSRTVPLSVAAMFFGGLAFPLIFTTASGMTQFLAPPDMRARLITTVLMVGFGAQPLAALAVGYSAQLFGPPTAVGINGLLMTLGAAALLVFRPGLRRWEVALPPEAGRSAPAGPGWQPEGAEA
ncbi:MAG: MFS transporter [Armatimonadetes bacterium]|nr:MFS transporter [Armatimonadota bacterium]